MNLLFVFSFVLVCCDLHSGCYVIIIFSTNGISFSPFLGRARPCRLCGQSDRPLKCATKWASSTPSRMQMDRRTGPVTSPWKRPNWKVAGDKSAITHCAQLAEQLTIVLCASNYLNDNHIRTDCSQTEWQMAIHGLILGLLIFLSHACNP